MNILLLAMSYFPWQKELGKDGHEFIRLKKSKYTYDDENPKETNETNINKTNVPLIEFI